MSKLKEIIENTENPKIKESLTKLCCETRIKEESIISEYNFNPKENDIGLHCEVKYFWFPEAEIVELNVIKLDKFNGIKYNDKFVFIPLNELINLKCYSIKLTKKEAKKNNILEWQLLYNNNGKINTNKLLISFKKFLKENMEIRKNINKINEIELKRKQKQLEILKEKTKNNWFLKFKNRYRIQELKESIKYNQNEVRNYITLDFFYFKDKPFKMKGNIHFLKIPFSITYKILKEY